MSVESRTGKSIIGDVDAVTDVTVSTKGGSMTAILKKALRNRLGRARRLSGAALEFSTGQAVILLSATLGKAGSSVLVHKIGNNRFEIELDTGEDEEIDDVSLAFLKLKELQFTRGELLLSGPVTADEWRAEMDDKLAVARKASKNRNRATTGSG